MKHAMDRLTGLALLAGAVWLFTEKSGGWWITLGVVFLVLGLDRVTRD